MGMHIKSDRRNFGEEKFVMSEANGCLLSLNCLEWLFISGAMASSSAKHKMRDKQFLLSILHNTYTYSLGVCAADTVTSYRCFLHSSLCIRLLFVVNREMARCFRLNLVFLAQTRTFARSQALILLAQLAWLELAWPILQNSQHNSVSGGGSRQQATKH